MGRDYGEVQSIYVNTDLKNWTNSVSAYVVFAWTNVSCFSRFCTLVGVQHSEWCCSTVTAPVVFLLILGYVLLRGAFRPSGTRAFQASEVCFCER